jgi:Leucine-rich repeat (LRR) protein
MTKKLHNLYKRCVIGRKNCPRFFLYSQFLVQLRELSCCHPKMSITFIPLTVGPHLFETSPKLSEVNLASNAFSRLNDGTFGHLTSLNLLDLSHNSLMRIEDNVFVGMNISHLDLGFNNLRKTPSLPLRKLTAARTLILDGNPLQTLGKTRHPPRKNSLPPGAFPSAFLHAAELLFLHRKLYKQTLVPEKIGHEYSCTGNLLIG